MPAPGSYQEDDEKSIDFKASCISYFIVHLYQKPDGEKIKYFYWNDLKSLYTEESQHRMTKYIKSTEIKEFYTTMKEALANTKDRNFMKKYGVEFDETKKKHVKYDENQEDNTRVYGFRWEFRFSKDQLDYEVVKRKYIELRKKASNTKTFSADIHSTAASGSTLSLSQSTASIELASQLSEGEEENMQQGGKTPTRMNEEIDNPDDSVDGELNHEKTEKYWAFHDKKVRELEDELTKYKRRVKYHKYEVNRKLEEQLNCQINLIEELTAQLESEGISSSGVLEGDTEPKSEPKEAGDDLVKFIQDCEWYFEDSSEQLSLQTGFFCLQLMTFCGVSKRKIPQVIMIVLLMFFGFISKRNLLKIVKHIDTYALRMEAAGELVKQDTMQNFNDCDAEDSVVSCNLIQDASNKKDRNLCLRFSSCLLKNGNGRLIALEPEVLVSKKAAINAAQTKATLSKTLTAVGRSKIKGGTTDNAATAANEMIDSLKSFDEDAVSLKGTLEHHKLIYKSAIPGMQYHHDQHFRQYRLLTCTMHSTERIFEPLLSQFAQKNGLEYDFTIGQNLFRIHYYMKTYFNEINYFNTLASEGLDSKDTPSSLIASCATRWLSQGAACEDFLNMMKVPITQAIMDMYIDEYGEEEANEIFALYPCIGGPSTDDASYLCIMFHWLYHHTTKMGDDCKKVLGFLASPLSRISCLILAATRDFHLPFAAFADSKGNINDTRILSARIFDLPTFNRNRCEFGNKIETDWVETLESTSIFIKEECKRAEKSKIPILESECMRTMDDRIKKAVPHMIDRIKKYCVEPLMEVGFSPLGLLDPYLSGSCASAFITILTNPYRNPRPTKKSKQSSAKTIESTYQKATEWRVDSSTEAFPGVSMAAYKTKIIASFIENIHCDEILKSLGFHCAPILPELQRLKNGELLQILKKIPGWEPGKSISHHQDVIKENFPAVFDSLWFNYSFLTITSVACEQAFSCCNFLLDSNDSKQQAQLKILYYENIGRQAIRDLRLSNPKELYEKKETLVDYSLQVFSKVKDIIDKDHRAPSRIEIRGNGKRRQEVESLLDHVGAETEENARKKQKLTIDQAEAVKAAADHAQVTNEFKKNPKPKDAIAELVHDMQANVIRKYIEKLCPDRRNSPLKELRKILIEKFRIQLPEELEEVIENEESI